MKKTKKHQLKNMKTEHDPVNRPKHYTSHPSGIEVIDITEHMNFCLGNVVKYVLRAEHKGNTLEDLKKARWYLNREIDRREHEANMDELFSDPDVR
jgi:hypothetical protein